MSARTNETVQHPQVRENRDLENAGFIQKWNSIPFNHAKQTFMKPLDNALGCIYVEHDSLLHTAKGIDVGGNNGSIIAPGLPLGTYAGVPQTHASDQQMRQHLTRNIRLYYALLNRIEVGTPAAVELEEGFHGKGIHAYKYIEANIELELTDKQLSDMDGRWATMTLDNLGFAFDETSLHMWYKHINTRAMEFPTVKSHTTCYTKFMDGLPSQLSDAATFFRMRDLEAKYKFPATLPTFHPQYVQGQANLHPYANQPDLSKICVKFTSIWMQKLENGDVRRRPRQNPSTAMVAFGEPLIEEMFDEEDFGFYSNGRGRGGGGRGYGRGFGKGKGNNYPGSFGKGKGDGKGGKGGTSRFTDKTRCYQCGGLGHIAVFTDESGRERRCATSMQIDRGVLDAIVYPHIASRANEATAEGDENADGSAEVDAEGHVAEFGYYDGPNWWD